MKWGYLWGTALVAGPFLWLLASGFGKDPSAINSPLPGRPAPPFALVSIEGKPVRLSDYSGKPLVINFWATWCVPCVQEHPLLQAASQRFAPAGVEFLGVIYQDEAEKVRRALDRAPVAYPTLLDPDGQTAVSYGVTGVPESFFIRPDGVVDSKMVGPLTESELMRRLAPLGVTGGNPP